MVCLGRKLRVGLKDSLLFLVVFCLFVLSTHNEVFMMRFSYLHNYVPILISLAVAAYITFFLRDKPKSIWRPMLGLMAGLLLGASNELAPLAVVFITATLLAATWLYEPSPPLRNGRRGQVMQKYTARVFMA